MVNYITVKGTYLLPDGVTPNAGYVEFRPNVALTISDTGVVFSEPLRAVLDEDGYFSLRLMTTNDPAIAPTGWLWFVDEKIEHGNQWYMQTLSVSGGGVDPLDITRVFYPPGAEVNPPHVVDPAPIGPTGPKGDDATLYESPSEPIEGVSVGVYAELWVDTDATSYSGGHAIQDEGVPLVNRNILNFVGAGVSAVDDSANDRTNVVITATGSGGGEVEVFAQTTKPADGSTTLLWVDTDDTSSGGSSLSARTSVNKTTASLAANAAESGTIQLAAGYRLLNIATSAPARVRLYTTAAKRDADASRPIGTDPTGDHGLVLEFVTTSGLLSADLSPTVDGFDGKSTPDGLIPYTVTNTGTGAVAITVTLNWLRTE